MATSTTPVLSVLSKKQQHHRIIAGAIGGAVPVLLNLARAEPATMFQAFDAVAFAGQCVQALVLATLGGIVAYYWLQGEREMWKVVSVAMTAPAMLTAVLNAKEVGSIKAQAGSEVRIEKPQTQPVPALTRDWHALSHLAASGFLLKTATTSPEAGRSPPSVDIIRGIPRESRSDAFWRGVLGVERPSAYFVSAGKFDQPQKARAIADSLKKVVGPNAVVTVANDPFVGASGGYHVLVGPDGPWNRPRFIANDIVNVTMSDIADAERVARTVGDALGRNVGAASYVK